MTAPLTPQHPAEETLLWYHYGEDLDAEATARHLGACLACRRELDQLRATLKTVEAWAMPERDAAYGERVWERLARGEGALAARSGGLWQRLWAGWLAPRRLVLAGSLAVALAGAFWLGRASHAPSLPAAARQPWEAAPARSIAIPEPAAGSPVAGPSQAARERVLAGALSEHLAHSERILLEILNGGEPQPPLAERVVVLDAEQARASDLLDDNRLYRQTAVRQGQLALGHVLEELEQVLLEVARGPREPTVEQRASLRARVDDQQLLFKVRVLEARLRDMSTRPLARAGAATGKG